MRAANTTHGYTNSAKPHSHIHSTTAKCSITGRLCHCSSSCSLVVALGYCYTGPLFLTYRVLFCRGSTLGFCSMFRRASTESLGSCSRVSFPGFVSCCVVWGPVGRAACGRRRRCVPAVTRSGCSFTGSGDGGHRRRLYPCGGPRQPALTGRRPDVCHQY